MSDTYYTQNFDDLRINGETRGPEIDKCIPKFRYAESMKGDELIRIEMVEIITPGDRLSRPVQKVTEEHRRRWPRAYESFKQGLDPSIKGTPIARWDAISESMQSDLRALGFQSVEQLAESSDENIVAIPNGALWRKKAQVHVSDKNRVSLRDEEIAKRDVEIASLKTNQEQMLQRMTALMEKLEGGTNVLHASEPSNGGAVSAVVAGNTDQPPARRKPGRPAKPRNVAGIPNQASTSNAA